MSVHAGTVDIAAAYLGATALDKIYVGAEQVWPAAGGGGELVTANMVANYDAENAASFTFSSGTSVTNWGDLSGNSRTMNSLGAPSTNPSRSGSINGHTAVVFGPAHWLLNAGSAVPSAQPYTVYLVIDPAIESTGLRPWFGQGITIGRHTGQAPDNVWFTGGHPFNFSINGIPATPHLIVCRYNGASGLQRIDEATVGTADMGTTGFSSLRISDSGGGATFTLGQFIVYSAAHTLTEIQQNEAYLADKWGL